MLPGEREKVHDPLSVIMSTERKTSIVSASSIDDLRIVHEGKRLFDEESDIIQEGPEESDSDADEEEDGVEAIALNDDNDSKRRSSVVPPSPSPNAPRRKSSARVHLEILSTPPPKTRG